MNLNTSTEWTKMFLKVEIVKETSCNEKISLICHLLSNLKLGRELADQYSVI